MKRIVGMMVILLGLFANAHAVPPVLNYAGQVTVNGEAFDGVGLFKFALVNADGNETYWSNDGTGVDGSETQVSVSVAVKGGLYAVLLGNTAQQGMGPIDPSIFAQHTDAKLRVWFSDGVNGFQQLSPDRPFASVPYAFSAGTAQTAGSATIAPGSIDRSMLSGDIRSDLNRTISYNDLSPQIKTDINATIGLDRLSAEVILKLEQNATITNGSVTGSKMADGAVTAIKMADGAITTDKLNEQILKYLKPEITSQPQAQTVYEDTNVSYSVTAEGKYLTYQWKKDGVDIVGETNATLNITDANATLHDGNYSVVVSNDFGGVNSEEILVDVNESFLNGLVGWWRFDEGSGTVAYDSSGNGNDGNLTNGPTWTDGKIGGALSFDGVNDHGLININQIFNPSAFSISFWVFFESDGGYVLHKGTDNQNPNLRFYLHGLSPTYDTFNPRFYQDKVGNVNIASWYHFSLQVDELSQQFYKNGILGQVGTRSMIVLNDFSLLKLGARLSPSQEFGHFIIDDLRIYDRALSAEEVQALYNLGQ